MIETEFVSKILEEKNDSEAITYISILQNKIYIKILFFSETKQKMGGDKNKETNQRNDDYCPWFSKRTSFPPGIKSLGHLWQAPMVPNE